MKRIVTSSEIGTYKNCPRKWWFRYDQELVPIAKARAPEFGSMVHAGLSAHYEGKDWESVVQTYGDSSNAWNGTETQIAIGTASALIQGYLKRDPVRSMGHKVIGVEREFQVPLKTTSGSVSRKYVLAGKVDLVTQDSMGNTWLWDHKTASKALDATWLSLADQMRYYLWADWNYGCVSGDEPIGIIYNLIRKPSIQPRQGDTPEDYATRLAGDTETRPEFYYQRESIIASDIETIGEELLTLAKQLGKHRYRNPGACQGWGCAYRDICIADTSVMRAASFERVRVHAELEEVA